MTILTGCSHARTRPRHVCGQAPRSVCHSACVTIDPLLATTGQGRVCGYRAAAGWRICFFPAVTITSFRLAAAEECGRFFEPPLRGFGLRPQSTYSPAALPPSEVIDMTETESCICGVEIPAFDSGLCVFCEADLVIAVNDLQEVKP
jgi:hypothetical protein